MTDDRPPRPDPLGVNPDAVPDTLREREAWVCWRYKFDNGRDEWTKVPVDVDTGVFAKSTDPDTWASFPRCLTYHERAGTDTDGVEFVVHDGDAVLGLDLDAALAKLEAGERVRGAWWRKVVKPGVTALDDLRHEISRLADAVERQNEPLAADETEGEA